jgi:hypothetical protein
MQKTLQVYELPVALSKALYTVVKATLILTPELKFMISLVFYAFSSTQTVYAV